MLHYCPYRILGLSKSATRPQIRKAYLEKVMIHHPDRLGALPDSEKLKRKAEFLKITRAYEILSKHRKEFDSGRFKEKEQPKEQQYSRSYKDSQYNEYWARRARYQQTGQGENPKIYGPNTVIMMGVLGISSILGYLSYNAKMKLFRQRTRNVK